MVTWSEDRIRSILIGYAVAASTAGLSMILQIVVSPQGTQPIFEDMAFYLVLCAYAVAFSAIYAAPFAAPLVYVAERWKIQSVSFYTIGGAVAGILALLVIRGGYEREDLETFRLVFIGGLAAGFAYWIIAGRHAGRA